MAAGISELNSDSTHSISFGQFLQYPAANSSLATPSLEGFVAERLQSKNVLDIMENSFLQSSRG